MERERLHSIETPALADADPTEIIDTVRALLGPAGDRLLELGEDDIETVTQSGTCSAETMEYLRGVGRLIDIWRAKHPDLDVMDPSDLRADLKLN